MLEQLARHCSQLVLEQPVNVRSILLHRLGRLPDHIHLLNGTVCRPSGLVEVSRRKELDQSIVQLLQRCEKWGRRLWSGERHQSGTSNV